MDKVKTFLRDLNDRRKAFRLDHKLWHDGLFLALVCILTGFVWGAYVRGAIAAPLTCDLTNGTLTCPIAGTPTPPVIPPVVPPGGGGGDFAGCPAGSITHKLADGVSVFDSEQVAPFGGQALSVRFVVAASATSNKATSVVEYRGPPLTREAALSTKPCSFASADAIKNAAGAAALATSQSPGFTYRAGTSTFSVFGVPAGTVLYFNVRNVGCPGDCGVRVTIRR